MFRTSFHLALHLAQAMLCLVLLPLPAAALPQADRDQKIDLSLRDADLITVLESFAAIAGGGLDVGPEVMGKATIELNAVPWRHALGKLCQLNALSCFWSELDGPQLVVRRSDGFTGTAESISMSLRGADLEQTLLAMDMLAGDEFAIERDPAATGEVSIDLESTPWPVALEEMCRNAGCAVQWRRASARVMPLDADAKALREATYLPAELWVDPQLSRDTPDLSHQIEALRESSSVAQPVAAFDELCEQAGCRWALHWGATPRLEFEPRPEPSGDEVRLPRVSSLPTFGARSVAVQVSLDNAVGTFASHDVQFDWGHPVRRVSYATADGTAWLTLTWLSFTPERHVLLPSVAHCDEDGVARQVSMLDPLVLPLDAPWSDAVGDVSLAIRSLPATDDPVAANKEVRPACLDTSVRFQFELSNLAGGEAAQTSPPRTWPGNYLMIRPPAAEPSADPLAALVYLGSTGDIDVVAQVRPGDAETPPTAERIDVSGPWSIRFRYGDPDEPGYLVKVTEETPD